MGEKNNYRDLVVWQRAIDLVPEVYQLVKKLPKEETYALGDQLRRAVVSIPANAAEGQARQHHKEFLQHLSIAKGSLAELHTLLTVAQKLRIRHARTTRGHGTEASGGSPPPERSHEQPSTKLTPSTRNRQPATHNRKPKQAGRGARADRA